MIPLASPGVLAPGGCLRLCDATLLASRSGANSPRSSTLTSPARQAESQRPTPAIPLGAFEGGYGTNHATKLLLAETGSRQLIEKNGRGAQI